MDKIQQVVSEWCKKVQFNQATICLNCEKVLEKSFYGGYVDDESREVLLSAISKWNLESAIELFCFGDKLTIDRFASDDSVLISLRKVTNNRTNSILIRPTTSKWCEVEPVAWLGDVVNQNEVVWRDDRNFATATQIMVR